MIWLLAPLHRSTPRFFIFPRYETIKVVEAPQVTDGMDEDDAGALGVAGIPSSF